MRQSRARAASDRLTSLETQKEHSEQLHVQGAPVQRSAHPSCAAAMFQTPGRAVQPLECAGQTATTLMSATAWTHWPVLLVYPLTLWCETQELEVHS